MLCKAALFNSFLRFKEFITCTIHLRLESWSKTQLSWTFILKWNVTYDHFEGSVDFYCNSNGSYGESNFRLLDDQFCVWHRLFEVTDLILKEKCLTIVCFCNGLIFNLLQYCRIKQKSSLLFLQYNSFSCFFRSNLIAKQKKSILLQYSTSTSLSASSYTCPFF